MLKSRTTLRDIAKVLNVSVTTVSRALNDRNDISPAMKQRVVETAELLDYKPNTLARSLRNNTSSKLIGVIVPELDHYFYSTIIKGITTGHQDGEYCVIIGESGHNSNREMEVIEQYMDHYVAGLVLVPSRDSRSYHNIQTLKSKGLPFLLIDRTYEGYEGSFVRYDDFEGARMATNHLIQLGKKNIGLLRGSDTCSISANRHKGYKAALQENNLTYNEDLVLTCPEAAKKEAYQACERLWSMPNPPDAIFTITDQLAAGVYHYAHEHSISIPEELSVVGYSNSEISDILYPRLTTVNQDGLELGSIARQQIIKEIIGDSPSLHKTITTELIVRNSCQANLQLA